MTTNVVTLSRLNSLTTLRPERSENGKNLARKSRILPQKTVFCDLDKRLRRSAKKVCVNLFITLLSKNREEFNH